MSNPNITVKVLKSKNKEDMKDLITSDDKSLGPALRIINMESFAPEKNSKRRANKKANMNRRSINKTFFECLEDVEQGRHFALLWLKKNIDFEVCDVIIEDAGYTGSLLQVIKENVNQRAKSIQSVIAKKIKDNMCKCIKKMFSVTYDGIKRLVLVTLIYLDLSLDSILLFVILKVLGPTIAEQSLFSTQIAEPGINLNLHHINHTLLRWIF